MSKTAVVSFKGNKKIDAEIQLTGSKSECNRALIISALSKSTVRVNNPSNAADTVTLTKILNQLSALENSQSREDFNVIDVGPAGTAMRFLSAYLAVQSGSFLLTGTERMKQRPIAILVDALKTLGAEISYAEEIVFPPLKVHEGFSQQTNSVKVKGNISSQYISALLMIAPTLPLGLKLEIEGELTSKPYVDMTLDMLAEVGVTHSWDENIISIDKQGFKEATLTIEPDWSAASYWYSIAALAADASIDLPALKGKSLQGDSQIENIMNLFGVSTSKTNTGVQLKKNRTEISLETTLDLKTCPDLAQTIVVVAAVLGKNATFTGLETLKIKETNRVLALQTELAKIGVTFTEDNLMYTLDCTDLFFPKKIKISTYEDHRMAMAFAPLALVIDEVEIEDMDVVEKSYPMFWEDLRKAGFEVK